MDVLTHLTDGFASAFSPMHLLLAFAGCTLGSLVGVLPGLGPATTVALLLPLTYVFDPVGALVLFAGIYYGAMYGGSTTAILLNVPGETASMLDHARRPSHGPLRPGRRRAGHRRHRLLRGRDDRHRRDHLLGPAMSGFAESSSPPSTSPS